MATIYDVAKHAGVSIGTVSKYLNKNGYINPIKKNLIKQAIDTLHYTPNRAAKQLKMHTSEDIAIILPNLTDKIYSEFFTGVSSVLMPHYRVIIYLTNDFKSYETQILKDCVSNHCAGIILCTCQPSNTTLFSKIGSKTPLMFVLRAPINNLNYNFVGFNDANTIYSITDNLLKLGYKDIVLYVNSEEFSGESDCIHAFNRAYLNNFIKFNLKEHIFTSPPSKEETFLNIMKLFTGDHTPSIFITTSYVTASAINEVAHFQNPDLFNNTFIISLGEGSLYDNIFCNPILSTFRDCQALGRKSAQILIENIFSISFYEPQNILLDDLFPAERLSSYLTHRKNRSEVTSATCPQTILRIVVNELNSTVDALKCILPRFIKDENINIEITALSYKQLFHALTHKNTSYDLFLVDALWLPYLVSHGLLEDLTASPVCIKTLDNLQTNVSENISSYKGRIYGIPCMYTMPLLYYRKDLFYDDKIAANFSSLYKEELRPPKNWSEFNVIAKYFTRQFNPSSPTLYGTSLSGGAATHIMTELYPRIWSYGGSIFDKYGFVTLYSPNNLKAIKNLVDTIKYSSPKCLTYTDSDSINDFTNNKIAMCTSLSNSAYLLRHYSKTQIKEDFAFVPIPSNMPISAGWNFAINTHSKLKPEAYKFLEWFISPEIASAYSILGGASPLKAMCENNKLLQLYPWTDLVNKEYHTIRSRNIPETPSSAVLNPLEVDTIISSIIYNHFTKNLSLDYLLKEAHNQLCAYAADKNYPLNPDL